LLNYLSIYFREDQKTKENLRFTALAAAQELKTEN